MNEEPSKESSSRNSGQVEPSGVEDNKEANALVFEENSNYVFTDAVNNMITYTLLPEQQCEYQLQLLQVDEGNNFTPTVSLNKSVDLCIICKKQVGTGLPLDDNIDLLKLLCNSLNFGTIEPLLKQRNLSVGNSQFCECCAKVIMASTDILNQIKLLEENLEQLRHHLKKNIKECWKEESNARMCGDDELIAGTFVRKVFVQCWSDCRVEADKLQQDVHFPKSGEKNKLGIKKIPELKKIEPISISLNNAETDNVLEFPVLKAAQCKPKARAKVRLFDTGKKLGIANAEEGALPSKKRKSDNEPNEQENVTSPTMEKAQAGENHSFAKEMFAPDAEKDEKRQRQTNPFVVELLKPFHEQESSHYDDAIDDPDFFSPPDNEDSEEEGTKTTAKKTLGGLRKKKPSGRAKTHKIKKIKQFVCGDCGRGYDNQKFYDAHIKTHNGELPFQCELCEKKFSMKIYLLNHNRKVHNLTNRLHKHGSSSKCIYCGLDFLQSNFLQPDSAESILGDYSVDADPLSVTTSEKTDIDSLPWSEEKKRRDHIRDCPENPRIKYKDLPANSKIPCDQCDKTFITLHALRSHLVSIHYKIFKLFCEMCGAGFLIMSDLKRHIEYVHTDEKKYHCDQCDYKFKTPRQLKYHRRRHTGQIPYTCEVCGKGFITSDKLKVHLTIHSEDKPFECLECGKFFKSNHNLYNHKYTTHAGARKIRAKKNQTPNNSKSKGKGKRAQIETSIVEVQSSDHSDTQTIKTELGDESVLYFTC